MKWKNIASGTTVFFVTATITEWQPVFEASTPREILLADMEFYRSKYGCRVLAYVIMPEHYHMVIAFREPGDLHGWLHDFQMHTANELSGWLRETADSDELEIYGRHANGVAKLAVWKEQARAVGIASDRVLRAKVDYVHENPVRRKLVGNPGDWPWSSWRNYYQDDDDVFRIDRIETR